MALHLALVGWLISFHSSSVSVGRTVFGSQPLERTPLVAPPPLREPIAAPSPVRPDPQTITAPPPSSPPPEAPPEIAATEAPELPFLPEVKEIAPPEPPEEEPSQAPVEEPDVAETRPRRMIGQVDTGLGIEVPASPLERAMRALSSGDSSPRYVVGSLGDPDTPGSVVEARSLPRSPSNTASNIEMLSDSRGVDFQPYLVQVLTAVRRNWAVLIPQSVRLGQRGRVVIQVAVETDGRIAKLVIASSSGFDPLDRAAVGALTASEPFPPLPREFTNSEVRLQFNFSYNRAP